MDVDVDLLGRDREEKGEHRMPVTRQHVGVSPAHGAGQQAILDRATVDEKVLVIGDTAVVGRQACNARQVGVAPLGIDEDAILGEFARHKSSDP
ncbi:hypothetical protein MBENS4_3898 [Novosphingobium sp. MBES04]|nr:hypothetical protein MBENS4_3898 [Novosphingobium sp. MBES04]